jgi:hypothetical protein
MATRPELPAVVKQATALAQELAEKLMDGMDEHPDDAMALSFAVITIGQIMHGVASAAASKMCNPEAYEGLWRIMLKQLTERSKLDVPESKELIAQSIALRDMMEGATVQ